MCMMIFTMMPLTASATTKTKTYKHDVLNASGLISALDVYGRDTITFKYDGKKVVSSSAKQTSKNLGTRICEKGGIKRTVKKSGYHQYKSTWYVNFSVLPNWIEDLLGDYMGKAIKLTDLGRFATATTKYTVYKNGTVKKSTSVKWYVPTNLKKMATFIDKYLLVL